MRGGLGTLTPGVVPRWVARILTESDPNEPEMGLSQRSQLHVYLFFETPIYPIGNEMGGLREGFEYKK